MSVLRIAPILILAFFTGCLAETYPGVVIGNPDEEGTSVPGAPGESPDFDFPNGGSYQPSPSDDPSSPGSVDKETEEETAADSGDQDVPGGDRIGEPEPPESPESEDPPPAPSRPEYAQPYEEFPDSVMMVQEN